MTQEKHGFGFGKWRSDFPAMRPPQVLSIELANELMQRCEKAYENGPPNKIADVLVPAEIMHELLIVWRIARES